MMIDECAYGIPWIDIAYLLIDNNTFDLIPRYRVRTSFFS